MTTTTAGDTTVTLTTDAGSTGPIPMKDFERAARSYQQLSFDVGGDHTRPTGASLKITGAGSIRSQLFMDDDVRVQVVDAAGVIVAQFDGTVVDVGFKKHPETKNADAWVERVHKIKLGDA